MLDKKQTEQLYDIQNNSEWLLETLKATQEENAVLKKALELACEDIKKSELFAIPDIFNSFEDAYMQSAKKKLQKEI